MCHQLVCAMCHKMRGHMSSQFSFPFSFFSSLFLLHPPCTKKALSLSLSHSRCGWNWPCSDHLKPTYANHRGCHTKATWAVKFPATLSVDAHGSALRSQLLALPSFSVFNGLQLQGYSLPLNFKPLNLNIVSILPNSKLFER